MTSPPASAGEWSCKTGNIPLWLEFGCDLTDNDPDLLSAYSQNLVRALVRKENISPTRILFKSGKVDAFVVEGKLDTSVWVAVRDITLALRNGKFGQPRHQVDVMQDLINKYPYFLAFGTLGFETLTKEMADLAEKSGARLLVIRYRNPTEIGFAVVSETNYSKWVGVELEDNIQLVATDFAKVVKEPLIK
jgi:hypothetical protein